MVPTSPINLPIARVIPPIMAIVTRIPMAKTSDKLNVRFRLISPCELRKPIIRGILDRWHGLRTMLSNPHAKAENVANQKLP